MRSDETRRKTSGAQLLAFPMHGLNKMQNEGFRTRDAHLIEWLARSDTFPGGVEVLSRPEPRLIANGLRQFAGGRNIVDHSSRTWHLPRSFDRRRWWVDSARLYATPFASATTPALIWNPFVAVSRVVDDVFCGGRVTVADLLDDWTVHYAFSSIKRSVEDAYKHLFDKVDHVVANAEGTVDLAKRYGRNDVVLVANGVDPDKFSVESRATGPFTVGYVGKIGKRVDLELVTSVVRDLPDVRFTFAGPILDREYRLPLMSLPNVNLLGDVHYSRLPNLLTTFDVGWVPHRVGEFEVGGDVIKTYEYRAAGLPVLTTPIVGAGARGLSSINVLPGPKHVEWLRRVSQDGDRMPRDPTPVPRVHTWQGKANQIASLLRSGL